MFLQADSQPDLMPKIPSLIASSFKYDWIGKPAAGFSRSDMTHEMAHTFGLHDTYYNGFYGRADGPSKWITNPYFGSIRGRQPIGVMWNPLLHKRPALHERDGMAWLYRYYVNRDLPNKQQCLAGYVYDKPSRGCIFHKTNPPPYIFSDYCLNAGGKVTGGKCVCGNGNQTKIIDPLQGKTCLQVTIATEPDDLYCRFYTPDWKPPPGDATSTAGKYETHRVQELNITTSGNKVWLEYRLAWHWNPEQKFFIPWRVYRTFNSVLRSKGPSRSQLLAHFLSAAATAQAPKARSPHACFYKPE